jgi:2-iminobutanoate/2-iminopropanoate deaminase
MTSSRTKVETSHAPKAIGPYSQAIVASGKYVFCSGQIPIDPASGILVGAGSIADQTKRVMENLKTVLQAAGSSLDRVVKTTIYLTNLGDFAHVNEVYGSYFTQDPPARATVGVAALPRGALVEIDAIATVPD